MDIYQIVFAVTKNAVSVKRSLLLRIATPFAFLDLKSKFVNGGDATLFWLRCNKAEFVDGRTRVAPVENRKHIFCDEVAERNRGVLDAAMRNANKHLVALVRVGDDRYVPNDGACVREKEPC